MSKASDRRNRLANRLTNAIIEELFVAGTGAEAERLMLVGPGGRDLGGWAKFALLPRVKQIIKDGLKAAEERQTS